MSVQSVKDYLDRFGAGGRVLEFDVSSATVDLAAEALGCEGARIAKSIAFSVGEGAILVVSAGGYEDR